MKKWTVNYCGNVIEVQNSWASGERLYVNGELQDQNYGMAIGRATLRGKLKTGELVKVSLGGNFSVHCSIFVNYKLVMSK
jgi:hypothetical protein